MSACEFKLILDATNFVADDLDKHKARSRFKNEAEARERANHLSVVHKCYVELNEVRELGTYFIGVGEIKE